MNAAFVLMLAAVGAPQILVPGPGAQTTRQNLRLIANVAYGSTVRISANGRPVGRCEVGGMRGTMAHCRLILSPGENRIEVTDGKETTEVTVTRYVTTGPMLPGVDPDGFGVGTMHRDEVEKHCTACHRLDEWKNRTGDADMVGTECVRCHADLVRRSKQHGPVGQTACLVCHDANATPQRYQVAWPIQETCFKCHFDIQQAMETKAYRHGPAAAGRCTTCHDPHGSENEFWLKKPTWNLCTGCHTEKATDRHVVVGFVYGDSHPVKGRPHPRKPGVDLVCSSCHNPHASQARYMWQFDVTRRVDLCQTCHNK